VWKRLDEKIPIARVHIGLDPNNFPPETEAAAGKRLAGIWVEKDVVVQTHHARVLLKLRILDPGVMLDGL
jgi:hypothetical protein